MPENELQKQEGKSIEELVEYFGVPLEKVGLRLTLFNVDK